MYECFVWLAILEKINKVRLQIGVKANRKKTYKMKLKCSIAFRIHSQYQTSAEYLQIFGD
jgi:hypothetical protein